MYGVKEISQIIYNAFFYKNTEEQMNLVGNGLGHHWETMLRRIPKLYLGINPGAQPARLTHSR